VECGARPARLSSISGFAGKTAGFATGGFLCAKVMTVTLAQTYDRQASLLFILPGRTTMSFLDDLLGGQGQQGGTGSLIGVASQLIEKAGGVQGLVSMLQQHGLRGAVQSWVGTGANQPVSGDQLGQALQNGGMGSVVQEAASKLGVDPNVLLSQLSQVLPHAVDHLTPDGQLPAAEQGGGFNLGMLEGLAGKLLGNQA
jgi:uncharacterized protein YidB (DUF937 family)